MGMSNSIKGEFGIVRIVLEMCLRLGKTKKKLIPTWRQEER